MISLPGYRITQELFQEADTVIYRGQHEPEGTPVIIKLLKPEYSTPTRLARLRHEYEITRDLDVDGVVKPYGLESCQQGLALIQEDFGGVPLQEVMASQPMALGDFFAIALPLVHTLGELHQHHLIHKDLKPQNILVNLKTGQVKISGFGIASRLSRENPQISNSDLQGTLAYLSPEQTGRMNRAVDYRTDFYSLGVTFYEMLTGQVPFPGIDPMELIHAHMAKMPVPPHMMRSEIPWVVSDIVLKLLAKTAEDRYQSAYGLKADLEECLRQWEGAGKVDEFPLGQKDVSSRLQVAQKLYGRKEEVVALLSAFDQVSQGQAALVLVSGYTGIGKTKLVNEIHKPVVGQRGYFISGKFDQLKRNIPYLSLIQAFQELIRQLLTESEARITVWKAKLMEALGPNGQVIIDMIPEVEWIIGPQPPVPSLGPTEAQNRFRLVLQDFVRVFARAEHPLVIFLDDLQWADSASLSLIQRLVTDPSHPALLLMGAYRDNEVDTTHPLWLALEDIRKTPTPVHSISLGPLAQEHIVELLADTLRCEAGQARALADLVLAKTGGNPFFMNQFLQALYEEGLLKFDLGLRCWQWDLAQIQGRGFTDNVVELLVGKMMKLAERTQQVLRLAACIGNPFDLKTLSIVSEQSQAETAAALWEALQEGLLLPLGETYSFMQAEGAEVVRAVSFRFLHDRVQQAAYGLISEEERKAVHLKIGQLLLKNTDPAKVEDKLFDIVNHLNMGQEWIRAQAERYELARLNLRAGQKAVASIAYEAALKHFSGGMALLAPADESWQNDYELAYNLHLHYAEALAIAGRFEEADKVFHQVIEKAKTAYEKARCYEKYSMVLQSVGKASEALRAAQLGLGLFGITFPETPEAVEAEAAQLIAALTQPGTMERLAQLEKAGDTDALIDRLYERCIASSYFTQPQNLALVISKNVKHILDCGITPESGFAIISFATMLQVMELEQKGLSFEYGEFSLKVMEGFDDPYFKGKTALVAHGHRLCWKYPFRQNQEFLNQTFLLCHSAGDLQYANYALNAISHASLAQGSDCQHMLEDCQRWHDYCQQYVPLLLGEAKLRLQALRQLMDIEGETIDAEQILSASAAKGNYTNFCGSLFEMALSSTLLGDYQAGYDYCQRAELMVVAGAISNVLTKMMFYHIYGICCARLYSLETDPGRKQGYLNQLHSHLARLRNWAELTPDNFYSYYTLVEAELARALGEYDQAASYYLKTIQHAKQHEYTLLQGVANESLAELYELEGHRFAKGHVEEAYNLYLECGAKGKAKALAKKYPYRARESRGGAYGSIGEAGALTTGVGSELLDLATVMKASHAISGEIVLDKLLEKLMHIVMENAGAQKGCLILDKEGHLLIEAEAGGDGTISVLQAIPVEDSPSLSAAIVQCVARTKENVVLSAAAHEGLFTADPYVVQNQAKSILCAPFVNRGRLVGLLYLENNLTAGAFTPERLQVLSLLSSQAAISIENARLYREAEQRRAELQRLSAKLRQAQESERKRIARELHDGVAQTLSGLFMHLDLLDSGVESLPPASSLSE